MKKLSQKAFHVRQFVKNLQVESEVYNTREEAEQAVSAYMSKNTSDVLYQERRYIRDFLQKHDEKSAKIIQVCNLLTMNGDYKGSWKNPDRGRVFSPEGYHLPLLVCKVAD